MTEPRNRGSPRLCFSKEELENPELAQKAEKAEQTADRYDAAKKKLQKGKNVLAAHCHNTTGGAYVDFGLYTP